MSLVFDRIVKNKPNWSSVGRGFNLPGLKAKDKQTRLFKSYKGIITSHIQGLSFLM